MTPKSDSHPMAGVVAKHSLAVSLWAAAPYSEPTDPVEYGWCQ